MQRLDEERAEQQDRRAPEDQLAEPLAAGWDLLVGVDGVEPIDQQVLVCHLFPVSCPLGTIAIHLMPVCKWLFFCASGAHVP